MKTTRFLKKTLALAAMAVAMAAPAVAGAEDTQEQIARQNAWAESSDAPDFHADWLPEERELLLHMRNHLKNAFMKESMKALDGFWEWVGQAGFANHRDSQAEQLYYAKVRFEWLCMLDRVISGGYASLPTAGCRFQYDDFTIEGNPQCLAAYLGEYEAMKMLILHGADPNALARVQDEQGEYSQTAESPLASVIANVGKGSYAGRMELAEWLLAHGAGFDVPHVDWLAPICCGAWCDPEGRHPELFEWGLDKGVPLTRGMVGSILDMEGTLPLVQRLLKEGRLDPKNPPEGICLLVYMCGKPGNARDAVEKMRLLLEAGAPVDGVEPQRQEGESDEDWEERDSEWEPPIQTVQFDLELTEPEALNDDYGRLRWEQDLQFLELLILHGAEASLEEDDLPEAPAMAEQVKKTIHRAMESRNKK